MWLYVPLVAFSALTFALLFFVLWSIDTRRVPGLRVWRFAVWVGAAWCGVSTLLASAAMLEGMGFSAPDDTAAVLLDALTGSLPVWASSLAVALAFAGGSLQILRRLSRGGNKGKVG